MSYRYERGGILITTNKTAKDWPEALAGDEVMATVPLDQLIHRRHMINIERPSYRLRDVERLVK